MAGIPESNTCIRGCCSSKTIPLHLPPPSFSLLSPLAKGSESIVYNALLDNKRVAAKKPILSTSDDLDKFHRELQLWCKVEHPGLAKFVAAHAKPPNYLLFFEFYEMGNLADKLHAEEWSPRIDESLLIAYELAKTLQYLHSLGINHRDIKPANILLDNELHPHIADFGLAVYKKDLKHVSLHNWKSTGKPTGGFHKKNMVGTIIYMAPEILKKEIQTEKSDVYSFAITVNELLTGVVPYTDLRAETQAHTVLEMSYTEQQLTAAVVSENLRPAIANAPPSLISLIQRCWDPLPINRPSFLDIVNELHMIIQQLGKLNPGDEIPDEPSSPQTKHSLPQFQENLNWFVQGEQLIKEVSKNGKSTANIWQDFKSEPLHYIPTLSWGSFSTLGRRETMEDTHFLHPQLCNKKDIHAFGIFDGHRGAAAAEFSVRVLPELLQSFGYSNSPSEALTEAFIKTDIAFRTELNLHRNNRRITQKDWHPGCTAITSLIVRNKLFVANAGDCRVILCRRGYPFPLSKEHVASCPDERKRVMSEGVGVKWLVDTWRVGPAALQVSTYLL